MSFLFFFVWYMVYKQMCIVRDVFVQAVVSLSVIYEHTMPLSTVVVAKEKQHASDQLVIPHVCC